MDSYPKHGVLCIPPPDPTACGFRARLGLTMVLSKASDRVGTWYQVYRNTDSGIN